MPNWIFNIMWVSGPPEDVDCFVAVASTPTDLTRAWSTPRMERHYLDGRRKVDARDLKSEILSFEHFLPTQRKKHRSLMAARRDTSWLPWRLEHWGTKWDANWPWFKRVYRTRARYEFHTAWDAPIYWVRTVSLQYPTLLFRMRIYAQYAQAHIAFRRGVFYRVIDGRLRRGKLQFYPRCFI